MGWPNRTACLTDGTFHNKSAIISIALWKIREINLIISISLSQTGYLRAHIVRIRLFRTKWSPTMIPASLWHRRLFLADFGMSSIWVGAPIWIFIRALHYLMRFLTCPIHQCELRLIPRCLWHIALCLLSTQVNLLVDFRQICNAIGGFHLRRLLYLSVYTAIELSLKGFLKDCLVGSWVARTKGASSVSTCIIIVGVTEGIALLVLFD
jgi:hypothetical protein